MVRIHKVCGGHIIDRKCLRCGRKFGLIKFFTTSEILDRKSKFDPKDYRKRIREGRDLP